MEVCAGFKPGWGMFGQVCTGDGRRWLEQGRGFWRTGGRSAPGGRFVQWKPPMKPSVPNLNHHTNPCVATLHGLLGFALVNRWHGSE